MRRLIEFVNGTVLDLAKIESISPVICGETGYEGRVKYFVYTVSGREMPVLNLNIADDGNAIKRDELIKAWEDYILK